jgi:DNA-binding transcriptional MerR regulator
MFRIGEFSKIAQVSGRLLRYYDQLGLISPIYTDPQTGYRYYSAKQLPRLNRILALKELGLTLDQIRELLEDDITTDELRGMLSLKKAQAEQALDEQATRLRYIESRIRQIDDEGHLPGLDVVVKSVPTYQFLSVRAILPTLPHMLALIAEVQQALPAYSGNTATGKLGTVIHSDVFEAENQDVEVGYLLEKPVTGVVPLPGGSALRTSELPGFEAMATAIAIGGPESCARSYCAIGRWIESNGYQVAGAGREVFIETPWVDKIDEMVIEIQFPIIRGLLSNAVAG